MNRVLRVICFVFLVLSPALAAPKVEALKAHKSIKGGLQGAECSFCIDQAVALVNILLNGILGGETSTCSDLCGHALIPGTYEEDFCMALCDAFGIYEFIQFLEKEDIDVIYACELVHMCPIDDCPGNCMQITKYDVKPAVAAVGTTIHNVVTLQINQVWNGTGMLRFILNGPNISTESDNLIAGGIGPVGTTQFDLTLSTKSDKNNNFEAGAYTTQILICNGECGSSYPHSQLLASAQGKFKLTQ